MPRAEGCKALSNYRKALSDYHMPRAEGCKALSNYRKALSDYHMPRAEGCKADAPHQDYLFSLYTSVGRSSQGCAGLPFYWSRPPKEPRHGPAACKKHVMQPTKTKK